MRLMPRLRAGRSACIYILRQSGSVRSILRLAFASRSLIPGVVLRLKIEYEFTSHSSLRKGNEEQALDYG
jgi:hypothetical protein